VILASIFIGPPGRGENIELPPMVAENIASLKRHHPGLPHRLFSGEDLLAFLEEKFPREVLDAYNALKPYAYKADLARYCILHELGGIYADLAFYFVRPLPFEDRPVVFREHLTASPWDTCTSVIASPPQDKAMACAIDLVCANVKRGYYGPNHLCPTGPTLLGKAFAMTCDAEDLTTGTVAFLKRERLRKALPVDALPGMVRCLLLGLKVVAVSRKRDNRRGLDSVGIAGSDNYAERWKNRDVYESIV
jgi:hypothetical protein